MKKFLAWLERATGAEGEWWSKLLFWGVVVFGIVLICWAAYELLLALGDLVPKAEA